MKKYIVSILILLLIVIIFICNNNNQSEESTEILLSPLSEINLSVPEPSGLHYDNVSKTLWTVSDENTTIYNIDLKGKIIDSIIVSGKDLEGITMIGDSILVTILERDRIILFLDKSGRQLKSIEVNISGEPNKGLEGITYDPSTSHLYILNEKDPGTLLEIDTAGNIIQQNILKYASDYSGILYTKSTDELWIVSDEDEAIFKCTIDGTIIEKYKVNLEQIEGIAIDVENSLLYLVSDPLEKLFIYSLP